MNQQTEIHETRTRTRRKLLIHEDSSTSGSVVFEISRLLDIYRFGGQLMEAVHALLVKFVEFVVAGTVVSGRLGLGFWIENVILEVFGSERGGIEKLNELEREWKGLKGVEWADGSCNWMTPEISRLKFESGLSRRLD